MGASIITTTMKAAVLVILVVLLALVADAAPATKSHSKMREKMKAKMRAKTSSLPMPHKNKQAVPVAPKKISAQIGSLMLDLEKKGQSDKKSHTDKNDAQAIQPETQQYISKLESKIADMSKSVDGLTHQVHELEEAEYARTHEKKSSAPTSNGIGPLTSMTKPTKVTATKAAEPTKVTATKAKSNSHLEEEQEEVHENDDEEKDEKDEDEEVSDADEQDNASGDEKDESSQDQKEQLQDAEEDESDNSEADEDGKDEKNDDDKDEKEEHAKKESKHDDKADKEKSDAEEAGYLDTIRSYLPSNPLTGMFGGEEDLDEAASLEENTYGEADADDSYF